MKPNKKRLLPFMMALGLAVALSVTLEVSARPGQTNACNGCHAYPPTMINITTNISSITVSPGQTFAIGINWTGGDATGGTTTEVNWPTTFSNIGITRDNTLFNPLPRIPSSGINNPSGTTSSILTAPVIPGFYTLRVYSSRNFPWETDFRDITVVVTNNNPTYLISGYVTNQSDNTAVSGAKVTANTNIANTTDIQGFYSFSASNGTYNTTASAAGYNDNSTIITVNSSDVNNMNISMTPVQLYILSGYVTSQSNGLPLNGVIIQTYRGISTTTDASGFYSFLLSNGTTILTATLGGYAPNSVAVVVNGGDFVNANISLLNIPPGLAQSITVVTNRQAILDDPGGWDGGYVPYGITDQGDQWSGESTTIRWYALLMNFSGRAAQNVAVTSTLLFPNGSIALTQTNTTNAFGIVEFYQDLDRWLRYNGIESEGVYTLKVDATVDNNPVSGDTNFSYDEWGCGSSGSGCHKSQYWSATGEDSQLASRWASGSVQNSPYLHAWDNYHGGHGEAGSGECLTCHRGFDGINRTHDSRVTATPQYPAGIHNGKAGCTDCHATFGSGTMPIKQCYDCHPEKNNNLTVKTFSQTATSGYSYQPLANPDIMAHNPGQNIPCIMCHNNGHNIIKPDNDITTSNTYTEYQQCTICHKSLDRHDNAVGCTVCHSQDAHLIKFFTQDATYDNGNNQSYRGDCTNCHQNYSFLGTLQAQPMAGSFPGNAPQLPNPIGHSSDPQNGGKWNANAPYWVNVSQVTMCLYCHGETFHSSSALGLPSQFSGGNMIGQPVTGGTWCQQCHWQGASNYSEMVSAFITANKSVPPENTGNPIYGANQGNPSYFNHSSVNKEDSSCYSCHGTLQQTSTPAPAPAPGGAAGYSTTIQPIFNTYCNSCHPTAGVDLTSYSTIMASTYLGSPIVIPNDAANSTLYKAVIGTGVSKMPPGTSLTAMQIQSIADWINQGALNAPGITSTPTATPTPTPTPTPASGSVSYSTTIQPIFNTYCNSCHPTAGVDLTSYSTIMASTYLGSPIVIPNDAANSTLYKAVTGTGVSKMPPGTSLTAAQIQSIADWINQGALNDAASTPTPVSGFNGVSITGFMHNVGVGFDCRGCHYNWNIMNETYNSPDKYVNESMVTESVHANLYCTDCHTNTTGHPGTPPPKSGWKWCEDCHANQQNPQTNKSRHNIVNNPWNNLYNGVSVVTIKSCTICHNATIYDNSINTYGREKGIDCDYCHTFPDNVID